MSSDGTANGRVGRLLLLWSVSVLIAVASIALGMLIGPADISNLDLLTRLMDPTTDGHATASAILLDVRLPRVLGSFAVGACLALAGVLLQAATRNPVADPYLVGTSAGATLAAVGVATLAAAAGDLLPFNLDAALPVVQPLAAFVGAMVAVSLAFWLARTGGPASPERVLLAGLVLTAFAGAATSFLLYQASDLQLRAATQWLMGGVMADAAWQVLPAIAMAVLAGIWGVARAVHLNALALGADTARGLGVDDGSVMRAAVWLSSALAAAAVALAGIIGFVGLLVPHGLRAIAGRDHRWLVPGSVLLGGALLVWADALARVVVAPGELPLGILTALAGCPLLLAFVARRRRPDAAWSGGRRRASRTILAAQDSATGTDGEQTSRPGDDVTEDLLTFEGIEVRYAGTERPAVSDCAATLRAGELIAIVGPNGSGKSSLLRALAGGIAAEGVITDRGQPRASIAADPRWLAWLPQQPGYEAEGTVAELVELGRTPWLGSTASGRLFGQPSASDRAAVADALNRTGLADYRHRRLDSLSGGERQRAFLAMILAQGATVLLLDEPSAALDLPQAARTISALKITAKERQGLVVIALHDLNLALRTADRVAVLADGQMLTLATPQSAALNEALAAAFGEGIEGLLVREGP